MITLKHLAREFNIPDLYKTRIALREHFGKRRRWRWDPDTEARDLGKVRKFLASLRLPPDTPSDLH